MSEEDREKELGAVEESPEGQEPGLEDEALEAQEQVEPPGATALPGEASEAELREDEGRPEGAELPEQPATAEVKQGEESKEADSREGENREHEGGEGQADVAAGVVEHPEEEEKTESASEDSEDEEAIEEPAADGSEGQVSAWGRLRALPLKWALPGGAFLLFALVGIGYVIVSPFLDPPSKDSVFLKLPKGPVYRMKPFFLPLKAAGEEGEFVAASLVLELGSEDSRPKVEEKILPLRRVVFDLLSDKTSQEIGSEAAQRRLQGQILEQVHRFVSPYDVAKVYFADLKVL
jgi:flagellar basal body-associated protein FliL